MNCVGQCGSVVWGESMSDLLVEWFGKRELRAPFEPRGYECTLTAYTFARIVPVSCTLRFINLTRFLVNLKENHLKSLKISHKFWGLRSAWGPVEDKEILLPHLTRPRHEDGTHCEKESCTRTRCSSHGHIYEVRRGIFFGLAPPANKLKKRSE